MSLLTNMMSRVRHFIRGDRDSKIQQAAVGATASSLPSSTYDLIQTYGYDIIADYLRVEQDIQTRYIDYESMDEYPETSAIVTIYGDDATQPDTPTDRRIWVESPDRDIAQLLNDFLHRTIRIEDDLPSIARSLCKNGNNFEEIILGEEGVIGLNFLPAHTMRRIEGPRGETYGFVQDFRRRYGYNPREFQQLLAKRLVRMQRQANTVGHPDIFAQTSDIDLDSAVPFESWQVMHMRLRMKHRKSIYGVSVLEPARWIYKRLVLLEDAALIFRLQRANEKYAFYVDTGSRPANEAIQLTNFVRQRFKKKQFVNPRTGELDFKFNPLAQDEDLFIPVVDGRETTRVEVLGTPQWQHMEDIQYFKNKIFAACHVPSAYLSEEQGVNRAILSSEDVRFARTILRVQNEISQGIEKLCRVHMAAIGIPAHAVDFSVRMTVPSSIFELAQMEVKNARADLASRMREHVSLRWVLREVFDMTEEEADIIFAQRLEEAEIEGKMQGVMEKQVQSMTQPPGGLGGGPMRASVRSSPQGVLNGLPKAPVLGRDLPFRLLNEQKKNQADFSEGLRREMRSGNHKMFRQLAEVRGLLADIRACSGVRR